MRILSIAMRKPRALRLPVDAELPPLLNRLHGGVERVAVEFQLQSLHGLGMLKCGAHRLFQRIAQTDRGADLPNPQRRRVIAAVDPAVAMDLDEAADRLGYLQGQEMSARPLRTQDYLRGVSGHRPRFGHL